ncbi:MAG: zinc ribbon domain-containing protein [Anaerolineae bacterium]|jgi:hypothetical protein
MNRINWIQILAFGLVVMLIVLIGLSLLPTFFGGGYWGMGPGMMWRGGMRGGWCPWCGGTGRFGGGVLGGFFGLLLTLLGLLIPLGLLGLLIVGGVWLVRSVSRSTPPPMAPPTACPSCGQPVASDWRNCPYCGEEL